MAMLFGDNSAYAQTIFALAYAEDVEPVLFVGETHGKIVEPRGQASFGWDLIFQPDGYEQTYAEMDKETKNRVSQRYKAVQKFIEYVQSNSN